MKMRPREYSIRQDNNNNNPKQEATRTTLSRSPQFSQSKKRIQLSPASDRGDAELVMEKAEQELERRSKFLNTLILRKKAVEEQKNQPPPPPQNELRNLRVRASDMPLALQNRAFRCAKNCLDSMPSPKLDSKRLALALKKIYVVCGRLAVLSFGKSLTIYAPSGIRLSLRSSLALHCGNKLWVICDALNGRLFVLLH
ncbi:unnamed protein product [Cuscuta europaea]|uniref:Dynein light chain n=1 Tax=Cuscuta europaea TaxID=41803 RepID=A0A9P0Z9M4_CUSEU|nr:unnamed protein product [Cuscuta europaea]